MFWERKYVYSNIISTLEGPRREKKLISVFNNSCSLYYFEMSDNMRPLYEINRQFYT